MAVGRTVRWLCPIARSASAVAYSSQVFHTLPLSVSATSPPLPPLAAVEGS